MKRFYTFICGVLLPGLMATAPVFGQSAACPDCNLWRAYPGDTLSVLLPAANIREAPELTAGILDSVSCGTPVVLGQSSGMTMLKGIYAPWAQVSYYKQGRLRQGYIWIGTLALGNKTAADGTRFLYGIDRIIAPGGAQKYALYTWDISVKVLDAQQHLLAEKTFSIKSQASACDSKLLDGMGLDGLHSIFRFYFSGEACGVPTDYYYFGWNGAALTPLPGKTAVADAGVYYYEESLLFPSEPGGHPGQIIRLIHRGEADEEKTDAYGDPVFTEEHRREIYRWDGREAIKL